MTVPDTLPLSRQIDVSMLSENGSRDRIDASDAERAAIAELLGLVALEALTFDYALAWSGKDRLALEGAVDARLTQACVVTLEPLEQTVSIPVKMLFCPESDLLTESGHDEVVEVDVEEDAPEPIVDGQIDIGQLAYEHFAAELDPYPRKNDATFDWSDPRAANDPSGPFAALQALKTKN